MELSTRSLLENSAFTYSRARSLSFTLEFLLLETLRQTFFKASTEGRPDVSASTILSIREEMLRLLKKDAENIAQGIYPIRVLEPESPLQHMARLPRLLWDALRIQKRRDSGRTTEFDAPEAKEILDELPRYYRRNFHFQTNGYLSAQSAKLYEHQVEILFKGSADAMRRLLIAPIKEALKTTDGKGLTFLEIGAGTGSATRFMRMAFPKAKIVAVDLSEPYLKEAQRRLARYQRVDFLQADGAQLPFKPQSFDLIYSVFLFHELPFTERQAVLRECRRVVKPGGYVAAVDSIQTADKPDMDPLLENFPREYHEPFYRDYISKPLEGLFHDAGLTDIASQTGFFSKLVFAKTESVGSN